MIPQDIIDKVLDSTNIADVVGDYVKLSKKGANFTACCPFHDEKTPSLVVSPSKGIYKCFGCGKTGNVISFVMEHEHLTYPEAIKLLAKRSKIEVEENYQASAEERAKYAKRDSIKAVSAWAAHLFQNQRSNAKDYLASRKFKDSTIEAFGLGFALNDWHSLMDGAEKAGYKPDVLLEASLVGEGDRGKFDYFRNRIIFPICDITGTVVGFTGRSVSNDDQAKYQNSRDTELFKKGSCLFGIHLAKNEISKLDECLLLEGNFDVMRFHELGLKNTVAGCGTALTKEQIWLIRRFTHNVTMCYDGDAAGLKATFRNAELLLAEGMNVRMVVFPDGHDPDSFGISGGLDALKKLLEKKVDFVTFRHSLLKQDTKDDPIKQADTTKEIARIISLIPDKTNREFYIKNVVRAFGIDKDTVRKEVAKQTIGKVKSKEVGWIGLEQAAEAIESQNKCYITRSMERLAENHAIGRENTVAYFGTINFSNYQELNRLCQRLEFVDNDTEFVNQLGECTNISHHCMEMLELKFDIMVLAENEDRQEEPVNFISAFAHSCRRMRELNEANEAIRVRMLEECCELLSRLDETQRTIYTKSFADCLDVKESDLNKVLKPHLSAKKNKSVLSRDTGNVGGKRYDFDINNLPEYVDRTFFYRWGYFPAEDENGRKLFYVFRTQEEGLQMVGNFYIEPLFHVFDTDSNRNKRIVRINNAENKMTYYTEFLSEKLVEFGQFKKVLFNQGGNVFSRGKQHHHEIILASIANQFPKCYELYEFGQQPEGFYAFANAIYSDGEIKYTDDLGLVKHNEMVYYSPSYSKIYSELRQSVDRYENDRWFVFRESNHTDFATWAKLMTEVYKYNHNGHWALLFAIMSVFRSIIHPINRLFTAPFFIGPTESGKTQIAVSIRSLFMHPDAPLFNLNSGTDAAFFSSLERYRDVAMVFEEYNDYNITDIKFQGLKAAVYDGEGKHKKKDATSKDIDISKVNCSVILLGQEAPERDDGSLANRCILLHVPKKDDWTEEEITLYEDLKTRQKAGLSNILLDILKQRDIVKTHFAQTLKEVHRELKNDLSDSGDTFQSRLLNTVSLFLSICRIWEQHVPQQKLPFSYSDFYKIARAKVIAQSETISSTNRTAVFFETLEVLINKQHGGIMQNREFKLDWQTKLTLMKSRTETYEHQLGSLTRVLYLRLGQIQPLYADIRKGEALKMSNLQMYLKDHPAYIGMVKSTRFDWMEYKEEYDEAKGRVERMEKKASSTTSAIALNYEILQGVTGIDLEKYETEAVAEEIIEEHKMKPETGEKQGLIDFSKEGGYTGSNDGDRPPF